MRTCTTYGLQSQVADASDHSLTPLIPYCRYKSLKKYLKYRLLNSEVNGDGGNTESIEEEKDFLRLLYAQLKGVDRYPSPLDILLTSTPADSPIQCTRTHTLFTQEHCQRCIIGLRLAPD